ncbi:MAG: Na/Pi symporter [Phaeodactylibacter xiamenensis]
MESKYNTVLNKTYRIALVLVILSIFLLSLSMLGSGFKLMSKDLVADVFKVTSNPITSLFIGLFATALMQSSSTTTSIIVTLVAAGTLSFQNAIPMIMGANIGTSVTSTIVALGHIHSKDEYGHAISAATVHDFFNILVVIFLLPFELLTGYLSQAATYLAALVPLYDNSGGGFSILGATIKPSTAWIIDSLDSNVWLVLGLSLLLLLISLRGFSVVLRSFLIGKSQEVVDKYIFGHPLRSLFWGIAITAGVQSSSVTASLTVPLVASNRATLQKVFPFLIGANVGTTITALIAALSQNEIALAIAICHVIFNLAGVFIFFPIEYIRNIPVQLAEKLGHMSQNNRMVGLMYILVVFFMVPMIFMMFSR